MSKNGKCLFKAAKEEYEMCGITGFIDFSQKSDKSVLIRMTDSLNHRGPDDSGYSFYHTSNAAIGLGHKRLAIIDLSQSGHQPMRFDHIEIVYNGEVYNFEEIRTVLEQHGYHFHSTSDTEVILKAYHKWGIQCISRLNGMFAMAIYDKKVQCLYMIRDRTGIKPLFWYLKNNLFMFTSELKSFSQHPGFQKDISKDSLAIFFQLGYIPQPHSIFSHTAKVKAGHYLCFELNNQKVQEHKYWDVIHFYQKPRLKITEVEAVQETENIMKSAFSYRMISDVPVGIFLSGGYDSSIVSTLLQTDTTETIKTFTIGFNDDSFNEASYAKTVADFLKTDHTELYCTRKQALDIIPDLPVIYDEPFADQSAIPTILVSRLAKKNVTVALSADGGDEIFGGYDKYLTTLERYSKQFARLKRIFGAKHLNKLGYILQQYGIVKNNVLENSISKFVFEDSIEIQKIIFYFCSPIMNEKIISRYHFKKVNSSFDDIYLLNNINNFDKMLAIDYKTYLVDDILQKVDRATMSVSLEGREPLLDYRIIEFVAQLPVNIKLKDLTKKYLLKKITHQYLPKQLMDRPKMGFAIPLEKWLQSSLKDYVETYLSTDFQSVLNSKKVNQLKKRFYQQRINYRLIWNILMFQMWYEKWMV